MTFQLGSDSDRHLGNAAGQEGAFLLQRRQCRGRVVTYRDVNQGSVERPCCQKGKSHHILRCKALLGDEWKWNTGELYIHQTEKQTATKLSTMVSLIQFALEH